MLTLAAEVVVCIMAAPQISRYPHGLASGDGDGTARVICPGRDGGIQSASVGLDEIVSMKWSGVLGAGTPAKSMGAGRAKSPCEWASRGRDSPFDPWFGAGGEGRLQALRVIDRRYDLLALKWVQYPGRAIAGGMQRERAAGSLAKIAVYYTAHLAGRRYQKNGVQAQCSIQVRAA